MTDDSHWQNNVLVAFLEYQENRRKIVFYLSYLSRTILKDCVNTKDQINVESIDLILKQTIFGTGIK